MKRARTLLFGLTATAMVVGFQNCGPAGFKSADMNVGSSWSLQKARSCEFGTQILSHGASVVAYESPTGTCRSQTRTCHDGYLTGSYQSPNCETAPEKASCAFHDLLIPHGMPQLAFRDANVDYGGTCLKQFRTCNDGTLSGSYAHRECLVAPPAQVASGTWKSSACRQIPQGGVTVSFKASGTGANKTFVANASISRAGCSGAALAGKVHFKVQFDGVMELPGDTNPEGGVYNVKIRLTKTTVTPTGDEQARDLAAIGQCAPGQTWKKNNPMVVTNLENCGFQGVPFMQAVTSTVLRYTAGSPVLLHMGALYGSIGAGTLDTGNPWIR